MILVESFINMMSLPTCSALIVSFIVITNACSPNWLDYYDGTRVNIRGDMLKCQLKLTTHSLSDFPDYIKYVSISARVQFIEPGAMTAWSGLYSLHLDGGTLHHLYAKMFFGLKCLKRLSLRSNQVRWVDTNLRIFKWANVHQSNPFKSDPVAANHQNSTHIMRTESIMCRALSQAWVIT